MMMDQTVTSTILTNGTFQLQNLKNRSIDCNNNNIVNNERNEKTVKYFGGLLEFRTQVVWFNAIGFFFIHAAGFYGLWLCLVRMSQLHFLTTVYMYFVAWLGGEGTTVGAHRLWTHKSYKARRPLRILLIVCQTIAGQNSCWTWVRDHRQHHKYTDTDADPHNATRGFFFSHIGWLMMKKHPEVFVKGKGLYMGDLEKDPVVMFQKRYFPQLFILIGIVIPIAIPYLAWGEPFWDSVFICFFFRYILLLHITWSVNSVAHIYGTRPYDKNILPSESSFVSFVAYGEGWHNYHHAFPWDYKASEFGMRLNFTRTIIEFFEKIGWAYDLKEATHEMMVKRIFRTGDGSHPLHVHHKTLEAYNVSGSNGVKHDAANTEQQSLGW